MDNFNKHVHIREFVKFAAVAIAVFILYKLYVSDFSFLQGLLAFVVLYAISEIITEKLLFILYPLTEDEKQRLKNIIAEAEEEYSQTAYKSNKDPYEDNDNSHSLSSSNHRTTASSSDDSYDAYHTLREDDYRQDYGDDYEDAIQDGWEERKRRNNS